MWPAHVSQYLFTTMKGRSGARDRIPVVRQAVVASSFGFRSQVQRYFLTDAHTHSGLK